MKKALAALLAAGMISVTLASGCTIKPSEDKVSVVTPTEPEIRDKNGVGYNPSSDGGLTVIDVKPNGDTIKIPEEYEGKTVTAIDRSAFKMSEVKKVVVPDTVSEIPDYAFAFCKTLEEVELPDTINLIGKNAFCGCTSLKAIELPDKLESIELFAFDASGIETITIPKNVKSVGEYAFAECGSLKKVVFMGSTEVAENCFNNTDGVKVKAPKGSPVAKIAEKLGIELI